ncbi:MAG: radical SAM protein [Candidatus Methanosuratincola sp.]|jgi:radical SAM superfamily enzyme with C-terminal helix-hairpin-helix motif|nr:radical SAM protein [Candidatus Methanosuratincola sp.]
MRVLIIDGYTDEPAGLGVPPFIDIYPRYVAGAVWAAEPGAEVLYVTIDEARLDPDKLKSLSFSSDLSVLIAGVTVPGKYLSGAPATHNDAVRIPGLLGSKYKAICGPAVRFGFGRGGCSRSVARDLSDLYDFVITGDPEVVLHRLVKENFSERVDLDSVRDSAGSSDAFAERGARIIRQHPFFPDGLVCEIETYRGCPRSVLGGCSFCTEPLHGYPEFRTVRGIAREVAALHSEGAVNFRIGRQPDLLVYGSRDKGLACPAPNPSALRRLFSSIRRAAPSLRVLHIDNCNPATIAEHPELSEEALKEVVKYHTPGDTAALGIESVDEEVIRRNNLKVDYEGAMRAISLINRIGAERGENGMPHLLPGLNFVYGLPGETKKTYEENFEFMKEALDSGLLFRRVNLRQVMVMPSTRMESAGDYLVRRHRHLFLSHKLKVRQEIDLPMMKRVVPAFTVLRSVRTELVQGGMTWGRQVGSYPVLVGIPRQLEVGRFIDVLVLSHGPRSVGGLRSPVRINELELRELEGIPGVGARRAASIVLSRPFKDLESFMKMFGDVPELARIAQFIEF